MEDTHLQPGLGSKQSEWSQDGSTTLPNIANPILCHLATITQGESTLYAEIIVGLPTAVVNVLMGSVTLVTNGSLKVCTEWGLWSTKSKPKL